MRVPDHGFPLGSQVYGLDVLQPGYVVGHAFVKQGEQEVAMCAVTFEKGPGAQETLWFDVRELRFADGREHVVEGRVLEVTDG